MKQLSKVGKVAKSFLEVMLTEVNDMIKSDYIHDQLIGVFDGDDYTKFHFYETASQLKRQGVIELCGRDGATAVYRIKNKDLANKISSGEVSFRALNRKQIDQLPKQRKQRKQESKVEDPPVQSSTQVQEHDDSLEKVLSNVPDKDLSSVEIGSGIIALIKAMEEKIIFLSMELEKRKDLEKSFVLEKKGRIKNQKDLKESQTRLDSAVQERINTLITEKNELMKSVHLLQRDLCEVKQKFAEERKELHAKIDEISAKLANRELQSGNSIRLSSLKDLSTIRSTFKRR